MTNKEIVLEVAEAFNKNDADTILKHFSDDGEWNMLGDKVYAGKETIRSMFSEHPEMKVITCTQDHVIAEGDTVSIDGYVECMGKNEKLTKMFYCDVYELQQGKVRKMISYVVDKKD